MATTRYSSLGATPLRDALHHVAETARQASSSLREGVRDRLQRRRRARVPGLGLRFHQRCGPSRTEYRKSDTHCPHVSLSDSQRPGRRRAQHFATQSAGNRRRAIIAITDKDIGIRPELVRRPLLDLGSADAIVVGLGGARRYLERPALSRSEILRGPNRWRSLE
jgi:hypothetical protein